MALEIIDAKRTKEMNKTVKRYIIPLLIFSGIPIGLYLYCNINDEISQEIILERKEKKDQQIDITKIVEKYIKKGDDRESVHRYIRKNCYSFSTNQYKTPNPLVFFFKVRGLRTYGIFYDKVVVRIYFENELVSRIEAKSSFESI